MEFFSISLEDEVTCLILGHYLIKTLLAIIADFLSSAMLCSFILCVESVTPAHHYYNQET